MAERPSELEELTTENRSTADRIEDMSLEVGAPTPYSTTSLGDYPNAANDETALDATDDETNGEPELIRAQIEQTRQGMTETINAIQEKLSVSNIAEQVKDEVTTQISGVYESARDALLGGTENMRQKLNEGWESVSEKLPAPLAETGNKVGKIAKSNPIPFILAGVGLGVWLLNSRRTNGSYQSGDSDYDEDDIFGDSYAHPIRRQSTVESISENAKSGVSKVYEKAGDVANQALESISSAASTAYQSVSETAGSAYEQAGNLGTQAKEATRWTYDAYGNQLDENPLFAGGIALTVGAILGLSFPLTETENKLFGETRNKLLRQAKDAAGDYVSQAKQVVGEISQSVKP